MKRPISPITFGRSGKYKWLIFLLVVIIQFGVLGYIGWRWHNISVDGIPYQWKAVPRLEASAFGTDYIRVVFPEDTAKWLDDTPPAVGEPIYVKISRDDKGLMQIEGASTTKPGYGSDYMNAVVVAYDAGVVQFKVAFDRYRIAPELTDGIYDITNDDSVIASIRMKKGDGIIEGIFVNGIPLEACSNAAAIEASRNQSTASSGVANRLVEPGMVPPKEE